MFPSQNFSQLFRGFLVVALIFLLSACSGEKNRVGDPLEFVPENTRVLVRVDTTQSLSTDLKNNVFISKFSQSATYQSWLGELERLSFLQPKGAALLAFEKTGDSLSVFTWITRQHPELFALDSVQDRTVETLTVEKISYQKYSLGDQVFYTAVADSIFLLTSSEKNLQNILRRQREHKKPIDSSLEKAYRSLTGTGTSVLIRGTLFDAYTRQLFPQGNLDDYPVASWISADVDVAPGSLLVNGIALARDTLPQLLDIFKGTHPQTHELAKITPVSAVGFASFTYDDFDVLFGNLEAFRQETDSIAEPIGEDFFKSIGEVGLIRMGDSFLVGVRAIDGSITAESLVPLQETRGDFRDVSVKQLTDTELFSRTLQPFFTGIHPRYFARLDNFFVFAESEDKLQEVITAYGNETTLGFRPFYESHLQDLSSQSSMLFVVLHQNGKEQTPFAGQNFSKTPLSAVQFIDEGHFAHLHAVVKETGLSERMTGVSQLFSITLENDLLGDPRFFSNHLSKGKDIVVQDVTNKLYLISATGRVLWSKQLEGSVLGAVQEVDLLKNGRIQLAFATKNTFYVIDRNGKEVAPFPLRFKDAITQPLAVFDYDNNRNYRFVVTQDKELLMYDGKAKPVSGFTFKKATSSVALPPAHIRLGNKDYILVAEENGKLNILNRKGEHRIRVQDKFQFSDKPVVADGNTFTFLTADDKQVTIDQNGRVSTTEKVGSATAHRVVSGRTQVTLDDNILRINSRRIELPFGLYSTPKISVSNRRILISVTDLQQNKVYVYNSLGELLPNFPVFGSSAMEFGDAGNNGRPNGLTKGESNNVVLYEVN